MITLLMEPKLIKINSLLKKNVVFFFSVELDCFYLKDKDGMWNKECDYLHKCF